ncbi:hypothetical protein V501_10049 [Pseudogymnoascus sp. VKM F-4519 (FW-2642)]|nr:hypothetical protein V501_10049 [Pseudogymnoascus sp. VKM F-4519 (FW-2642)]
MPADAAASAPTTATAPPRTPDLHLHAPLTATAGLHEPPEQQRHGPAQQHLVQLRLPGSPLAAAVPRLWRQPPEFQLPAAHPRPTAYTYVQVTERARAVHQPGVPGSDSAIFTSALAAAELLAAVIFTPPTSSYLSTTAAAATAAAAGAASATTRTTSHQIRDQRRRDDRTREAQGIEIKTKFPVARIKRIMQADEEVGKVAQVTPVAVSKALELFMISLVTKSASLARSTNSKRVTAVHLKKAIEADEQFDFLNDIVSKIADGPDAGQGKRTKEEEDNSDSDEKPKKKGRRKKGE